MEREGLGMVENLLNRLDKVKRTPRGWKARCPTHKDPEPSLHIKIGDSGKILLFCFGGCNSTDVIESIGLKWSDLSGQEPRRKKHVYDPEWEY
jgi:DNA primase